MDLKRNDDEHVGEEKKKAFYQRQPHRRRNRIGMKMDSGIRNGVKYSKGHPGFWSITQPPHQSSLFLLGMSLSSVLSLQRGEQDKRS